MTEEIQNIEQDEVWERWRSEVDKGQALQRIDKYLAEHMAGTSRSRIQSAADAGNVWVNGKPVSSNYKIKPFDVIQVLLDHEPHDYTIQPEDIPLEVVYEDDDVLVINKPAGMVVHPGHGNYEHTLLNALAYYFRDKLDINDPNIGLVHRIDKDTSGLLLIAKTPEAKTNLGQQFFEHTTRRTYNALVWGTFTEDEGTITGALARDTRDRTIYRIWDLEENPNAKEAITHWRVLERYPYVTLVECRLETGRTHQIRVHMAAKGHPLLGDEVYGGANTPFGARHKSLIKGQTLHACELHLTHPTTGERMHFTAPQPPEMTKLLEILSQDD